MRLIYGAALRLAGLGDSVAVGLASLGLALAYASLGAALAWAACALLGPAGWAAAGLAVLKFSAAYRLLEIHVLGVARALGEGDVEGARRWVSGIVRRRVEGLPPRLVASAAIESLAENLVDGWTAPLTYYPLLGPAGPALQRGLNTLDGALGYRRPGLYRAGAPPAVADTIVAYLPARLTAALIAALSPMAGSSPLAVARCIASNRGATPSPNHWPPMAAVACALGVRLEKPGVYIVNPGGRDPGPEDVVKAVGLARAAALAWAVGAAAAAGMLAG